MCQSSITSKQKQKWYWLCLENFSQQITIHGCYYIGLAKLHTVERLGWFCIVLFAAFWAGLVIQSNWARYNSNPTVVSIKKDYRNWENPFPAVTGCFVRRSDQTKLENYIAEQWKIQPDDDKFQYYVDFINDITNISYFNMEKLVKYENDETLNFVDLMELTIKVHPNLTGNLVTFQTKIKSDWTLILTEMGICFSVNSKFAHILSPKVKYYNVRQSPNELLRCHYLNGLCYARYDSDPNQPIKYYVHSYLDVIHTSIESPFIVEEGDDLEINYELIETATSPELRKLTPTQRKCRFDDEPLHKNMPAYSTTLCYIYCRHKASIRLCGCKPFFYHFLEGKICSIKGMACLSKYTELFRQSPNKSVCDCPQPCELITYLKGIPKLTQWKTGYFDQRIAFRWGLSPPTTKYYRDVIFSFTDFIVSVGACLALFLGMSFMTAAEFLFLLYENVIMACKGYKVNKKKTKLDTSH